MGTRIKPTRLCLLMPLDCIFQQPILRLKAGRFRELRSFIACLPVCMCETDSEIEAWVLCACCYLCCAPVVCQSCVRCVRAPPVSPQAYVASRQSLVGYFS